MAQYGAFMLLTIITHTREEKNTYPIHKNQFIPQDFFSSRLNYQNSWKKKDIERKKMFSYGKKWFYCPGYVFSSFRYLSFSTNFGSLAYWKKILRDKLVFVYGVCIFFFSCMCNDSKEHKGTILCQ